MQGGLEFKSEIETLSRVHHWNLVTVIGFCFDQGEQILVYEYVCAKWLSKRKSLRYLHFHCGCFSFTRKLEKLAPKFVAKDVDLCY